MGHAPLVAPWLPPETSFSAPPWDPRGRLLADAPVVRFLPFLLPALALANAVVGRWHPSTRASGGGLRASHRRPPRSRKNRFAARSAVPGSALAAAGFAASPRRSFRSRPRLSAGRRPGRRGR